MVQLEISLISVSILILAYILFENITKRFRFNANKVFSLAVLVGILTQTNLLLQVLFRDSPDLVYIFGRLFSGFIFLVTVSIFSVIQIFPRWEKTSPPWFIIASPIPAIILFILTIATDLVFKNIVYNTYFIYTPGILFYLYIILFSTYLLGSYGSLLYKSKYLENDAFRIHLFPLIVGITTTILVFLTLLFFIPMLYNIKDFRIISFPVLAIPFYIIMNYFLTDERYLDFRKFYLKNFFWILIFTLTILPSSLILKNLLNTNIGKIILTPFVCSLFILILFVAAFRLLMPVSMKIINRKNKALDKNFNDILNEINTLAELNKQKVDWDSFFNKGVKILNEKLSIQELNFFAYKNTEQKFINVYSFGEINKLNELEETNELVKCLREFKQILEKSMFYTDDRFKSYKISLLNYYNANNIQATLPVCNHKEDLIGILLIGSLKNKKPLTQDFISVLDIYRVQLGLSYENARFSEEIREIETQKRDVNFVKSVKKRIIPSQFSALKGMDFAALHINNSNHGGDYFDYLTMGDKLGVFISNLGDSGVESALLGIQMHSILHSHYEKTSSESMMNLLNQILFYSKFTQKYVPAFYMIINPAKEIIYSNAAFNPPLLFDSKKGIFEDLDNPAIPLGIDKEYKYEVKTYQSYTKMIGVLYSDGITSAIDKVGNNYSTNRIKEIILKNKDKSPAFLIRAILADYKEFTQNAVLLNDVTLIIFKFD